MRAKGADLMIGSSVWIGPWIGKQQQLLLNASSLLKHCLTAHQHHSTTHAHSCLAMMRRAFERLRTRLGGGWGRSSSSSSSSTSSQARGGGEAGGVVTHPHNPSLAWPPSAKHSIACIEEITALSPTVKQVQLRLLCGKSNPPQPPFTFKAGQWVDFYIKGMERCGGYSMVSGPEALPQLTLAVKASELSEPAQWVHKEARPMDTVAMKVGGSFFFEMTPEHWRKGTRLVLLGGGVGINPLVSILRHVTAWLEANNNGDGNGGDFRVSMVYSAATAEELLFRQDIEALAVKHPSVIDPPLFICTRDPAWTGRTARIDGPLLSSLSPSDDDGIVDRTLVYVCGPASMIDDVERVYTQEEGPGGKRPPLRREQVLFERWW